MSSEKGCFAKADLPGLASSQVEETSARLLACSDLCGPPPEMAAVAGDRQVAQKDQPAMPSVLPKGAEIDLQATWDLRMAFLKKLDVVKHNEGDTISKDLISEERIKNISKQVDKLMRGGLTEEQFKEVSTAFFQDFSEMFRQCIRDARGERKDILVNLALLKNTINKELEKGKCPFRFGAVQFAVDTKGRLHLGLPVITADGKRVQQMLFLPSLLSPKEIDNRETVIV